MTNKNILIEACDREGIMNDNGYSSHHCFFRSEYKKEDWDQSWNIEPVRFVLHESIHHGGNRRLEVYYKKKAFLRYNGEHKEFLSKILKQKQHEV